MGNWSGVLIILPFLYIIQLKLFATYRDIVITFNAAKSILTVEFKKLSEYSCFNTN